MQYIRAECRPNLDAAVVEAAETEGSTRRYPVLKQKAFFARLFQPAVCGHVLLATDRSRACSPTLRQTRTVEDEVVLKFVQHWNDIGYFAQGALYPCYTCDLGRSPHCKDERMTHYPLTCYSSELAHFYSSQVWLLHLMYKDSVKGANNCTYSNHRLLCRIADRGLRRIDCA
ncbi:hypothetical protein BO83DRAFT_60030 [Aspergillus eucalypticola CBS 122712]|uniref:Uncharacterized protein n=1 Tax=Aspergillus eucalypticola (strain CBS 122712 / IBT 29274) TaxID=1448314 RepID=A0A317VBM3_ASPEC|nr:uncharacterized protein BO83DRAFT_60030 [Aspergillus eucalypticola CBS 122712]PWY70779.1 hypothetical protein BO83DRAFT_60030 [Aspergillus eucalypticola CBS 122712]